MNAQELYVILETHAKWLRSKQGGERANLFGANLSRADLSNADLTRANLIAADLYRTNLTGANLNGVELAGADLTRANLSGTNLSGADLSGANLSGANLSGANLSGANLIGTKFRIANTDLVVQNRADFTQIIGSCHSGYRVGDYLAIGCEEHHISYWLEHVRDIAKVHDYSEEEQDEYEDIVAFVARRARFHWKFQTKEWDK
jgi:hypothetical protein